MAEAVDSMAHGRNGPWPAARLPTTCSSACPPTACWSPRISSTPGPTSVWPVVLSVGGVWSGGVAGAVQEYRGDERGGFLDAGLVVGGQAGRGPEQAAERDCELVDGEVAAERPVVDAAAQERLDHRPDLLFRVPGVVRGAEPAGDGGVLAAAGGDHAGDAGDGLAHGGGVRVGFGEPGGDGVAGGGGHGLE